MVREFPQVFSLDDEPMTVSPFFAHKIRLSDDIPVFRKPYGIPFKIKSQVDEQLKKMLRDKIIQYSRSPYNSPLVPVLKKDGSVRICQDYRFLNSKVHGDSFPLPNIPELFNSIGKAKCFSSLDLRNGYFQIPLHPDSMPCTAFSSDSDKFEYCVTPQGISDAPAGFQRIINHVLSGLVDVRAFLDDILIYTESEEQHVSQLRSVFSRLANAQLSIKLSKCTFFQSSLKFLGHIVSDQGLKPDPAKVAAIKSIPVPTTVKQLQSFLGMTNYYRKFVSQYSEHALPLTSLVKGKNIKGKKSSPTITWNDEADKAFNYLKTKLSEDIILQYPDFSKPFELACDASDYCFGGSLSQRDDEGNSRPLLYYSAKFSPVQLNYSTIEKECFSIIYGLRISRPIVFGYHITVTTDHSPLTWLLSKSRVRGRLSRWQLEVCEYNLTLHHISGKKNYVADFLSRVDVNDSEMDEIPIISSIFSDCMQNNELFFTDISMLQDEISHILQTYNFPDGCRTHWHDHSHSRQQPRKVIKFNIDSLSSQNYSVHPNLEQPIPHGCKTGGTNSHIAHSSSNTGTFHPSKKVITQVPNVVDNRNDHSHNDYSSNKPLLSNASGCVPHNDCSSNKPLLLNASVINVSHDDSDSRFSLSVQTPAAVSLNKGTPTVNDVHYLSSLDRVKLDPLQNAQPLQHIPWPSSSLSSVDDSQHAPRESISIKAITVHVNSVLKASSSVIAGTDVFTKYMLSITTDECRIWSHSEILSAQQNDPTCQLLIKHVNNDLTDSDKRILQKELRNFEQLHFQMHHHVLCKVVKKTEDRTVYQTYVPPSLRHIALRLCHNVPSAGHGGILASQQRLACFAFWPACNAHVEQHVKKCVICLQYKNKYGPKAPVLRMHNTTRPFERTHVDLIGKVIKSKQGHEYILTMIDVRTRFLIAVPLRNKKAKTVAQALFERIISQYGAPETIVSDQGSEFVNSIWQCLMDDWSIHHLTTASYSPASNGVCERVNGTISKIVRTLVASDPKEWSTLLYYAVIAYNQGYHRQLHDSPFYLFHGRDPAIPGHIFSKPKENLVNLDEYRQNRLRMQKLAFERVQAQLDKDYEALEAKHKKSKSPELMTGMRVYIYSPPKPGIPAKFQKKYKGPMRIVEILGPSNTLIVRNIATGREHKVNLNNTKVLQESEVGKTQNRSARRAFPCSNDEVLSPLDEGNAHDDPSDVNADPPTTGPVLPAVGVLPQVVSDTTASDMDHLKLLKIPEVAQPCAPPAQSTSRHPKTVIRNAPNLTRLQPRTRMHLRSDGPIPSD